MSRTKQCASTSSIEVTTHNHSVKTTASPYYPPRAGRFGRSLTRWYRFRQTRQLERFAPPANAGSWPRLAFRLLVPGTLVLARGQRLLGRVLLTSWLTAAAAFCIWIGTAWSLRAFVLASAIHSISAGLTFTACLMRLPRAKRIRRASLYGLLFVLVLYTLLLPALVRRVVLPIQVQGTTLLINTSVPVSKLRRGDWIAYRFGSGAAGAGMRRGDWIPYLFGRGAAGFDRILALPGETIRFYEDAFEVGGVAYQRVANSMPIAGEVSVPESAYYVWPAGARNPHNVEGATEMLSLISTVSEDRVIGPAYHYWLWRKPELDPLVALKDWTPPSLDP